MAKNGMMSGGPGVTGVMPPAPQMKDTGGADTFLSKLLMGGGMGASPPPAAPAAMGASSNPLLALLSGMGQPAQPNPVVQVDGAPEQPAGTETSTTQAYTPAAPPRYQAGGPQANISPEDRQYAGLMRKEETPVSPSFRNALFDAIGMNPGAQQSPAAVQISGPPAPAPASTQTSAMNPLLQFLSGVR